MKSAILAAALTLGGISEAQSQTIPQRDIFTKPAAVSDLGNQINYSVRSILPPPQQSSGINNNVWSTTEKVVNKIDNFIDPLFRESSEVNTQSFISGHRSNFKQIGNKNGWNIQRESQSTNISRDRSFLIGYSSLLSEGPTASMRFDTSVQLKKTSTTGVLSIMNQTNSSVGFFIRLKIETK